MEQLALYGGEKIKTVPFGTGMRFGEPELKQLREAIEQNTLFYWKGNKVKEFTKKFASLYGMEYCVATSSCTAAIHTALGALGITEGDEVIVSPITDMGSIIGILYQNAIPIFSELNPHTYNMDAEAIEEKITDKTKAVIIVHLAGNPADMDAIMKVARKHGIYVIEDCAQSYLCYTKGRLAGSIGDIGCFSLNDFKHISTGDGGMLVMNDESIYMKAFRFADKNYNRYSARPDEMRRIEFLAPNYRMTELQGAVAIAQLDRLPEICSKRSDYGDRITEGISGLKGIYPPTVRKGDKSSYWFYMFRLKESEAGVDAEKFSEALNAEGIPCQRGYIPACVYEYDLFKNLSAYPNTHSPFDSPYYGKKIEYYKGMCPIAEEILDTAVKLNINEFFTPQDIEDIIAAIRKVANHFAK